MKITHALVLIGLAFVGGYVMGRSGDDDAHDHDSNGAAATDGAAEAAPSIWTCSMDPQVRLPEPGKCPICFMDLIPLVEDSSGAGPRELAMSEASRALAEIETTEVARRPVEVSVRMSGKIDFDETRVSTITAWVAGRLERLFVDYTGVPVQTGDHMVELYSPALRTAQAELLEARRVLQERPSDRFAALSMEASREKLHLLGLTDAQVKEIERRGTPSDRITIYAPDSGIVVHKNGLEGMYVAEGTPIYTVADLRRLWVKLDAYESDLPWLRIGQEVTFTTEAWPGEPFAGRIAFIDPVLDERTRSVKVRVNVENDDGRLKPGMFVRAVVRATITSGGGVYDAWLRDKWLCPMHPDVVRDHAGECDQCGMPLASAESLGYATSPREVDPPIVIPDSAPLRTGRRAVVFVEVPGRDQPTYELREVVLGPRTDDGYIVREGLAVGERVVSRGAFRIDSALQIQAKPSMMSMDPGPDDVGGGRDVPDASTPLTAPDGFRDDLAELLDVYLSLADHLAHDRAEDAGSAGAELRFVLRTIDAEGLDARARGAWDADRASLEEGARLANDAGDDLEALRRAFDLLSKVMPGVVERYEPRLGATIHAFHCPMAFDDRGASWLQRSASLANPYFGAAMFRCGTHEGERTLPAPGADADPDAGDGGSGGLGGLGGSTAPATPRLDDARRAR